MAKRGTVTINQVAPKTRKDYPDALPFGISIGKFAGKGGVYLVVIDDGHVKRVRLSDGKVFTMVKSGTPTTIRDFVDLLDSRYGDDWGYMKIDITATPDND